MINEVLLADSQISSLEEKISGEGPATAMHLFPNSTLLKMIGRVPIHT